MGLSSFIVNRVISGDLMSSEMDSLGIGVKLAAPVPRIFPYLAKVSRTPRKYRTAPIDFESGYIVFKVNISINSMTDRLTRSTDFVFTCRLFIETA